MLYALTIFAALAVNASPLVLPRQGVTKIITPSAPAPSGASVNYSGSFAIAVMNVTAASTTGGASTTLPASVAQSME